MRPLLFGLVALAACATVPPVVAVAPLAPNAFVDSTGRQIRLTLAAPPEQAATRVVQALVEKGIPVTSNQGGVIEAKLPREMGMVGQYEITVRAYVSPNDHGGARVLLFGEETKHIGSGAPIVAKISASDQGRALATWRKLEAIGRELGGSP